MIDSVGPEMEIGECECGFLCVKMIQMSGVKPVIVRA